MATRTLSKNERKLRRKSLLYKTFGLCAIWIVLLVMYIPILVLIAYSFNASANIVFDSEVPYVFTWSLYADLFSNQEIMVALGNTVLIALISSALATVLGTCGAIGAYYSKRRSRELLESVNQIPVVNAEIVIAMSLTVMFVFFQSYILGGANVFSFWTLLFGHMVLQVPFVYLSVKPKLQQMDPALYEAALDLGCTQRQALWKATIPEILPGVASGFLLAITLSLDDFIVTAFTRGAGLLSGDKSIETLSTLVQAKIKKGPIPPEMRALTTIIFGVVLLIAIGVTIYRNRGNKKTHKGRREA